MADDTTRPPPTVTYWAISIWNSRTFRTNAVLILVALVPLLDTDVLKLIPPTYLVLYGIFVKVVNIYLRTITKRPVAFIPIGATQPVDVPKVGPPDPPAVGD
jgi:hypothetical protein